MPTAPVINGEKVAVVDVAYPNFRSLLPWNAEPVATDDQKIRWMNDRVKFVDTPEMTATLWDDRPTTVTTDESEGGKSMKVTGPAWIRFRMVTDKVFPVGLAFRYAHQYSAESTGASILAMPRENLTFGKDDDGKHYVQFRDTGAAGSVHWKYFILVQDGWGNFAIIDPEIENEFPN